MVTGKNIRTKIVASHDAAGSELNGRPPFGINQCLASEPIRDQLLASGTAPEVPHLGGQLPLASNDGNGALKRTYVVSNVVSLHDCRKYTRNLVDVNKNNCLTTNKGACTVLQMAQPHKKPVQAPSKKAARKRVQQPETGPDGLTMAQRLLRLMNERDVGQQKLATMCSQYYSALHPAGQEERVKQQHIFNILQGQESSFAIPLIAAVFDVREMWLQFGIGPKERQRATDT